MLRYVCRNTDSTAFPRPDYLPDTMYELLVGRGIASEREAEDYLYPDADNLLDPGALNDMDAAAARLEKAMAAREAVCVYGDYDVDGVCASSLLSGYLQSRGVDARVYLPSRHNEGYGLNENAVRRIAGWAKLMVTVDCGVTSVALVELAKSLGMDVVVTDHHQRGEALPDCPVVNPVLGDYPFPLCGAGVAWKLVWRLGGRDAAMEWVDVAALATVADVVPLTGENRIIVRLGLNAMNRAPRPGIQALIESAGLECGQVSSTAIAFQLAPRLNAGGRLGSAQRSLELVTAPDLASARPLAAELESENTHRKSVEQLITREAEAQLTGFNFPAHRALILSGKDWNPGVIGLAASRLVEKYHYPVILLADQGDRLTGSCRSIDGVDIHAALTGCSRLIEKFGGHKQAAGLTLLPEKLDAFREAMDEWLSKNVSPQVYIPVQFYDAELDFEEVTTGLVTALECMQPTGFGNPAPVFRALADVVDARAVGAGGAHLKLTLSQDGHRLDGIAFREGARAGELAGGVDALFAVKLNTWMGRTAPQLEMRALADADVFARLNAKVEDEASIQCEFLTQVFYNKKIPTDCGPAPEIDEDTLARWMGERPQGTLVVTSTLEAAWQLYARLGEDPELCLPDLYLGRWPGDVRAFNAVCVCPASGELPVGYDRLVLASIPEQLLDAAQSAARYRLADAPGLGDKLPRLEGMREIYRALMRVVRRPAWYNSLTHLAHMVADEADIDDVTAIAALFAMEDMGLFEIQIAPGTVALKRCDRAKTAPEDSAVWNALKRWSQMDEKSYTE